MNLQQKLPMNKLAVAVNTAGLTLLCCTFSNKSMALSPLSANMAMTGVLFGTTDNARAQLAAALTVDNKTSEAELISDFKHLFGVSNYQDAKTVVKFVNALYVQLGFNPQAEFMDSMAKMVAIEVANFSGNAADEVAKINQYVATNTNNKIQDLLTTANVTADTRLVLVNALYFKSKWHLPFEKYNTRPAKFTMMDGSESVVEMMHQEEDFPYFENDNVQVLKMAYHGKKYSMLVVLPKNGATKLMPTHDEYMEYCEKCQTCNVNVSFPKFKHEYKTNLSAHFQTMGATEIFDVGGLAKIHPDLKIGGIIHAAIVEVDENGTEAAAATAVMFMNECCSMSSKKPVVFNANHTFSYFIRNVETNAIMFAGVHNG